MTDSTKNDPEQEGCEGAAPPAGAKSKNEDPEELEEVMLINFDEESTMIESMIESIEKYLEQADCEEAPLPAGTESGIQEKMEGSTNTAKLSSDVTRASDLPTTQVQETETERGTGAEQENENSPRSSNGPYEDWFLKFVREDAYQH